MYISISVYPLSTNSCLTLLTDKINKGFESGKYTSLILIDIQKVFYTIDHGYYLKNVMH